jgi:hypothetical protein
MNGVLASALAKVVCFDFDFGVCLQFCRMPRYNKNTKGPQNGHRIGVIYVFHLEHNFCSRYFEKKVFIRGVDSRPAMTHRYL